MFGVFKVEAPYNICVAWVTITSYPKILKNGQLMVKWIAAECINAAKVTGCEIVSQKIDIDTAEIVLAEGADGRVQTVILGKDYVYLICSPRYPPNSLHHAETQVVLNSFRLLS